LFETLLLALLVKFLLLLALTTLLLRRTLTKTIKKLLQPDADQNPAIENLEEIPTNQKPKIKTKTRKELVALVVII